MTLQIQSDHVYTQLGVPVSVTGVAQVTFLYFDFSVLGFYVGCAVGKNDFGSVLQKLRFSVRFQFRFFGLVVCTLCCLYFVLFNVYALYRHTLVLNWSN